MGVPALPSTLMRSARNCSKAAISMIESSTGFVQSTTKLRAFFLPLATGFLIRLGIVLGWYIAAPHNRACPGKRQLSPAVPVLLARLHALALRFSPQAGSGMTSQRGNGAHPDALPHAGAQRLPSDIGQRAMCRGLQYSNTYYGPV